MDISLMDAYIIETLKAHHFTYEEVATFLAKNDLTAFQAIAKYDFSLLQQLYDKDNSTLQEAFNGEYRVKFLTLNGLKNLLALKFQLNDTQYTAQPNGITHLQIDTATEQSIRAFLSMNWTVTRSGEFISILGKV